MLEKALKGKPSYWIWLLFLGSIAGAGTVAYLFQLNLGLSVTGMSRDVSWGFYIAQFTYLVGVAASAVMLVLPYYFHHYKPFKKMIILGEFMAIGAVSMCMLFILVDLGQPQRMLNVIFHATPNSILFWDMVVLNGYLFLNIIIGWITLDAERKEVAPPSWVKPLCYISIFWAVSIHTVTAFLYAGLPARHYFLTAIMAARFLSSAFCSGPAILLLLALVLEKVAKFEPGEEAIKSLSKVIVYAMGINVFFYCLELFTAFYSNIPGHMHPIEYLFHGVDGMTQWVPFMWTAAVLAILSLALLIPPKLRENRSVLTFALIILVLATWIDKGIGLLVGGFSPNMFHGITEYVPTFPEILITLGVYSVGAMVITVLWKIALSVKKQVAS
ncbi:MAG: sulfate reduction electron transfer complex DsrMKJOP subunit DsrP [Desulfovibrionaceae bacterium]